MLIQNNLDNAGVSQYKMLLSLNTTKIKPTALPKSVSI